MLSCMKPSDPGRRTSKEIEKNIQQWMKEYNKAVKILLLEVCPLIQQIGVTIPNAWMDVYDSRVSLNAVHVFDRFVKAIQIQLLGSGESGKTTIIKQMKILHIQGFNDEERKEKTNEIRDNIFDAMKSLVTNMASLQPRISLEKTENIESFNYFLNSGKPAEHNQEMFEHAAKLWKDSGIQQVFQRSSEFQLIDCAEYFLNKIEQIRDPAYAPDDQDILHSRKTTTEIQKIEFEVKIPRQYGGGSQAFWMFDVGGQKGERKKWIQVFEGIQAVLFLVASSSFDQVLREDNRTNRLKEAIELFEEVWNSRFLQESGIILFLNKQDALEAKIKSGTKIVKYFPHYANYRMNNKDGDVDNEYHKVRAFIRDEFMDVVEAEPSSRQCYWHYTTATNTNNIKTVFNDVHSMIISWNLAKIGPQ